MVRYRLDPKLVDWYNSFLKRNKITRKQFRKDIFKINREYYSRYGEHFYDNLNTAFDMKVYKTIFEYFKITNESYKESEQTFLDSVGCRRTIEMPA